MASDDSRESSSLTKPKRSPKTNNQGSSSQGDNSSNTLSNKSRRHSHRPVSLIQVDKEYSQTNQPSRADLSLQKPPSKSQSRPSQRPRPKHRSRSRSSQRFSSKSRSPSQPSLQLTYNSDTNLGHSSESIPAKNSSSHSNITRSPRKRTHKSNERSSGSLNNSSHSLKKSQSDPSIEINRIPRDRKSESKSKNDTYFLDFSELGNRKKRRR